MTGKNNIDVSAVFLTYIAFVGDVDKTALARDLDREIVAKLAKEEKWDEKIATVSRMTGDGRPGDFERAQNRALCFVQAHQTSLLLDRLIQITANQDDDGLVEFLSTFDKMGRRTVSAKFFSDLMAAMEKCHHLKYLALGDSTKEREQRLDEEGGSKGANALHAAVIHALNSVANPVDAKTLIDGEQAAVVKELPQRIEAAKFTPEERAAMDKAIPV